MELDDTDTLRNELTPFRTATFSPPSPVQHPPLILEVSLDTHELTPQQTLILVSSQTGQRHTVETPSNRWLRGSEIVLERWYIELVTPPKPGAPDLPVVYKKAVVLFRRVFTEARLLPVWRLKKRLGKIKLNNSLKLKVRVANGDLSPGRDGGRIAISAPLVDAQTREKITDKFSFGHIDTPAGYVFFPLF
jgi:autophagy-related protein 13